MVAAMYAGCVMQMNSAVQACACPKPAVHLTASIKTAATMVAVDHAVHVQTTKAVSMEHACLSPVSHTVPTDPAAMTDAVVPVVRAVATPHAMKRMGSARHGRFPAS